MKKDSFQGQLRDTKRKALAQGFSRTLDIGATSGCYIVKTSANSVTVAVSRDGQRIAKDMKMATSMFASNYVVRRSNGKILPANAKKK